MAERAGGVQAELAWVLDPAATGRGFATEAVREVLRVCFEELGLRRVTATCFADNEPSWRMMERLGMRREAHFRECETLGGEWADLLVYALLEEEYRAR